MSDIMERLHRVKFIAHGEECRAITEAINEITRLRARISNATDEMYRKNQEIAKLESYRRTPDQMSAAVSRAEERELAAIGEVDELRNQLHLANAVVDLARQYMELKQFDDVGEYKIVRGLEKALRAYDAAKEE